MHASRSPQSPWELPPAATARPLSNNLTEELPLRHSKCKTARSPVAPETPNQPTDNLASIFDNKLRLTTEFFLFIFQFKFPFWGGENLPLKIILKFFFPSWFFPLGGAKIRDAHVSPVPQGCHLLSISDRPLLRRGGGILAAKKMELHLPLYFHTFIKEFSLTF